MTDAHAPSHEELVARASKLVPLIQQHGGWIEENRRLHEEVIEALADAGIFKMRIPARYGGYESDTRTAAEVTAELGRADGSVGWNVSVWWIPGWMVGMFPDEVQDEIYSTPDVRVCGTLSPSATATPRDGGVVVNGRWSFVSGALHSHWQEILAMSPTPDGQAQPIMAMVPMSDLRIVDDWHTWGLRGSGSVTTVAEDVFVPGARVLPMQAVLEQRYASILNADVPMYRAPLAAMASACSVGNVVGIARGALETFLQRLPGRKITYTDYESQLEAPVTHLQVGEAALKVDEAGFHSDRVTELTDRKCATGEPWTLRERALARLCMAAVCKLGIEATDILGIASGGSSIYSDVAVQRFSRDIRAISMHALNTPHITLELYGRVLCGLEPRTFFI